MMILRVGFWVGFLVPLFFLPWEMARAASIRVLSYNVWLGGDHAGPLRRTVNVIRRLDPEFVGVQEADSNGPALASALGYHWYPVAEGTRPGGVLSRYPAARTFRQGIEVKLPSGERVAVFSVHLLSDPYEPYDLRDGHLKSPVEAVRSALTGRGSEIGKVLGEIEQELAPGTTVFLTGDFNEPSHLDWTVRAGPQGAGLHDWVVRWPTSRTVLEAGFLDAFRVSFPDETARPGFTWSPLKRAGEMHDRIDFIYYRGRTVSVESVKVAGEAGGPGVDIGFSPYPSDHRIVVGEFRL